MAIPLVHITASMCSPKYQLKPTVMANQDTSLIPHIEIDIYYPAFMYLLFKSFKFN